jgi:Domain of unknown function (DUF4411)
MSSKAGDEFVFDSSAFINGARHHYFLDSMPGVWTLVEEEIENGGVILIREVYREIKVQADPISKLVDRHKSAVVDPSQAVQQLAGQYQQKYFQRSGLQDRADPWIMAEAKERGAVVVTYEGITFSGDPAKKAEKKLPALCVQEGIRCCTLPQALQALGLKLG